MQVLDPENRIDEIDLGALDLDRLEDMRRAGRELTACRRALTKGGDTLVSELMRGQGPIQDWRHFPRDDAYDRETGSQYYFHLHPPVERSEDEYGHLHTFLRGGTVADQGPPLIWDSAVCGADHARSKDDPLCHLVGISVDTMGAPLRLFATNRWVTGEDWFPAPRVSVLLEHFSVDHARPNWAVNRYVTALVALYAPQIAALLAARDAKIEELARDRPLAEVLDDRSIEVLSWCRITPDLQIDLVERAWRRVRRHVRGASDAASNSADAA